MRKPTARANPRQPPKVRIIGGEWRGRKLSFLPAPGLRPTGDRMREMLFNWLQDTIAGSRCLDLFAGTGALGFEAASRGAQTVTLVEKDPRCSRQLAANRELLDARCVSISTTDAATFLRENRDAYDIVFVDPPFALDAFSDTCRQLAASASLGAQALIYLESPRKHPLAIPPQWSVHKHRAMGAVDAYLFVNNRPLSAERCPSAESGESDTSAN